MKKKLLCGLLFFIFLFTSFSSLQTPNLAIEKTEDYSKTYEDLEIFIKQDKTDENKWIEGEYVCKDFTREFISNVLKVGILCFPFVLENHAEVVCEVKEGKYLIEPQTDEIFELFI